MNSQMKAPRYRQPTSTEQAILDRVEIRLLDPQDQAGRKRYGDLMCEHHYLHSDALVGEQLRYVACVGERWVGLLSWSAAAKHLRWRDQWIGWSVEQQRRRRALVANNARFLILPGLECPNLATRVMGLCCQRLSSDWEKTYGHGLLVVESFVDSQLFRGTCYKAQGWEALGETRGFERKSQDYFVAHDRPKQLWVKELQPQACALLCAVQLPPVLRSVEDKVVPQPHFPSKEVHALWDLCRQVPEWRKRKGRDYPLPCVLAIIVMASHCGVVRGQRDLAAFASKLTQRQLGALRSYQRRDKRYDYPKETTFQRVLAGVDTEVLERILAEWSDRILGHQEGAEDSLVAIDGKAQCGSTPNVAKEMKAQVVSAQSLPSGRVLGSVLVEEKSNEIPAARVLLEKMGDMEGKLCMLDALHANQATLRQINMDIGADYLVPVKGNHEGLELRIRQIFAPAQGDPLTAGPPKAQAPEHHAAVADDLGNGFPPSGYGSAEQSPPAALRKPVRHCRHGR